jgi:hypothetical protein
MSQLHLPKTPFHPVQTDKRAAAGASSANGDVTNRTAAAGTNRKSTLGHVI